ncbi:Ras-related protein Rab-34 [Portunus trituberculatus]|uniref:Ras-related protein Rab-34 n=1 Tax=Portunus trituberculatus TaxID=210409 RepID=A0A5B7GQZ0_PORTR|nr:Ras-related protein Rab-34 [Portunus trituberculatus]
MLKTQALPHGRAWWDLLFILIGWLCPRMFIFAFSFRMYKNTDSVLLIGRFCHQVFDANYKATIGVDFEVERFDILGIPFNLQIWDTAGQERFKCIAASYYRGASGEYLAEENPTFPRPTSCCFLAVMIVFDVTNIVTLAHTSQWLEEARQANADRLTPVVFLVGTKRDLMSEGAYDQIEKEARRVAQGLGAEYWAVSSKTGDNVEALFLRVASLTFDHSVMQELSSGSSDRRKQSTVMQ